MKYKTIIFIALCTITTISITNTPRSRISTNYHKVHDKLSNHKGKVGLAAGAAGALLLRKTFSVEIDNYIKPFFKNVFKKVGNFFRRVFNRPEKM